MGLIGGGNPDPACEESPVIVVGTDLGGNRLHGKEALRGRDNDVDPFAGGLGLLTIIVEIGKQPFTPSFSQS